MRRIRISLACVRNAHERFNNSMGPVSQIIQDDTRVDIASP